MLYTIKEVSEKLKTNVSYVHKLRKAGLLKCIKIGQYKVRKETLEQFLKDYEGYDVTDPESVQAMKEGEVYETIQTSG